MGIVQQGPEAAGAAGGILAGAVKSAPAVVVSGVSVAGIPLSDLVYIVTLIWLCMQIGGWCWDRYKRRRHVRRGR